MIVQILIIIVVPLVIGIAILMLTSDTMKKIEARLLALIIVILFIYIIELGLMAKVIAMNISICIIARDLYIFLTKDE